jgi:hypothetical protein
MKTRHNKVDVNLNIIYSGKHDLIKEREGGREQNGAHIKHGDSENQGDHFLLAEKQKCEIRKIE